MYGIEVWYIKHIYEGNEYYFTHTKLTGHRVWTKNFDKATFFPTECEAKKKWEKIGKRGAVSGGDFV